MHSEPELNEGEEVVYSRCTKEEDAFTLQDLCGKCPIPARIQGGLPRIKAEIAVHRRGDTRVGFLRYCEAALASHLKTAARFANELANPAKVKSLDVGKLLEIKFWNLALCELYKAELELPQPSVAVALTAPVEDAATEFPYIRPEIRRIMDFMHESKLRDAQITTLAAQTAAATAQKEMAERTGRSAEPVALNPSLLPANVAESHTYFTALLQACAQLPRYDVAQTLKTAFEEHRKKGVYAWSDFIQRLPTYIGQYLSPEVQQLLNAQGGLLTSFRAARRVAEQRPENWPFWGVDERPRLLMRRQDAEQRLEAAQQDNRTTQVVEHGATLVRLERILAALEVADAAGRFVVNASELDAPPSTPPLEHGPVVSSGPLLSAADLRTFYLKALEHPPFVGELTPYQKSELQGYAEREKMAAVRLAVDLMDGNPGYVYPPGYQNGREVDYWLEKSVNYQNSLQVIQLLTLRPASAEGTPESTFKPMAPEPLQAFAPLLLKYTLPQLRELLQELGLVATDGRAVAAASPGAWVGVIHALLDVQPPRLRGSKAAIQRAFSGVFGADVSERAVQAGLGTNGSEAEQFRDRALAFMARGY